MEEKQRQQAEELVVLPLAQLDEGSVHLQLESLGVEVDLRVIDSQRINGAEFEAMSEPELSSMFGIATQAQVST